MGKTAFLLILLSVFLHAGWNFLSKANRPSKAFFVLANGTVALLTIPFVFIVPVAWGELGWKFWLLPRNMAACTTSRKPPCSM